MTTHPIPRDANSQLAVFVGGGADALAVVESTLEGERTRWNSSMPMTSRTQRLLPFVPTSSS